MATCQQSQNLAGSKFNCLNYILLYAEHQTPFNPDEMDIERKLFALAIWIWVGTLHQIQPEALRRKYKCFYAPNQRYFDYKCSLLQWQQQQPLSLGTVP